MSSSSQEVPSPTLPALAYADQSVLVHDPWLSVLRLLAVFAIIDACAKLCDLGAFYGMLRQQQSNLLVHMAFLDWRSTLQTIGAVGEGIFGAILLIAAIRALRFRPRSELHLMIGAVGGLLCKTIAEIPYTRFAFLEWSNYVRWYGPVTAVFYAIQPFLQFAVNAILPALLVAVVTRRTIRSRFK